MVGVTAFSAVGNLPISTVTGDPVARVAGHASLAETASAMVADNVGAMIVGDDDTPGALISERDIVRAVASGMDLNTVRAVDVASTKLVWCDADATIDEVATQMMDRYIRHVLVERDGVLAGIVSARDVLGVYCSEAELDFS